MTVASVSLGPWNIHKFHLPKPVWTQGYASWNTCMNMATPCSPIKFWKLPSQRALLFITFFPLLSLLVPFLQLGFLFFFFFFFNWAFWPLLRQDISCSDLFKLSTVFILNIGNMLCLTLTCFCCVCLFGVYVSEGGVERVHTRACFLFVLCVCEREGAYTYVCVCVCVFSLCNIVGILGN